MATTIRMRNCQLCQRQVVYSRGTYRRLWPTRLATTALMSSRTLLGGFKRSFICHRCLWRRRFVLLGIVIALAGGVLLFVRQTMAL